MSPVLEKDGSFSERLLTMATAPRRVGDVQTAAHSSVPKTSEMWTSSPTTRRALTIVSRELKETITMRMPASRSSANNVSRARTRAWPPKPRLAKAS